jgi:hypothetical protein
MGVRTRLNRIKGLPPQKSGESISIYCPGFPKFNNERADHDLPMPPIFFESRLDLCLLASLPPT